MKLNFLKKLVLTLTMVVGTAFGVMAQGGAVIELQDMRTTQLGVQSTNGVQSSSQAVMNNTVPQGFNFQAVARGTDGAPLVNQALGVQVQVIKTAEDGAVVYTETHAITTNALGVIQIVIGEGTAAEGQSFSAVNWGDDNYFVKLAVDPAGGTTYEDLGTTRLLSVPYALVAGNVSGGGESAPVTLYNLDSAVRDTSFIVNAVGPTTFPAMRINSSTDGSTRALTATANSTVENASTIISTFSSAPGLGTGTHIGALGSAINDNGTIGRRYGLYGQASSQGRENIGLFSIGFGLGDGEVVPEGTEVEGNVGGFNVGAVGFAQGNLNGNIGVRGRVYGTQGGRLNTGVQGFAETNSAAPNIGVDAFAFNSQIQNIGYRGNVNSGGAINTGMRLFVYNGTENTGAEINAGDIGLVVNAPIAANLNGTVNVNGDLNYTGALTNTSDRNLKENIQPLQNGISTIMKLNPTTYNFRGNGEYNGLKLATGLHYGLIAQEVEEVLPSLVKDNVHTYTEKVSEGSGPDATVETEVKKTMDYKSMSYTELIPVLIKAVQEQQTEIEKLKKELEALKGGK